MLTRHIGVVALVDAASLPDLVLVGDIMHIEARLKLRIELNDRAAEELPHADPRGIESADRVFSRTQQLANTYDPKIVIAFGRTNRHFLPLACRGVA